MVMHAISTFTKRIIAEVNNAPAEFNTLLTTGDVNGDGLLDIVVSGRNGRMVLAGEFQGRPCCLGLPCDR